MRYGILTGFRPGTAIEQVVRNGVRNFENAPHLRGHFPAEARFHPSQLPAAVEVLGLSVLPDERVKLDHVRVTTCDLAGRVRGFRVQSLEFEGGS